MSPILCDVTFLLLVFLPTSTFAADVLIGQGDSAEGRCLSPARCRSGLEMQLWLLSESQTTDTQSQVDSTRSWLMEGWPSFWPGGDKIRALLRDTIHLVHPFFPHSNPAWI